MRKGRLNVALAIMGTGSAMALLYFLRSILIPLVVAFILAILVDALVRSIVRRWPKASGWSVAAVAAILICLAVFGAIYVIAQGGVELVAQGPALIARLDQLVEQAGVTLGLDEPLHLSTLMGSISIPSLAGGVLASAQDIVSSMFLMLIYFGFILASRARFQPKIRNIAASSERAVVIKAGLERIATDVETYVWVQTLTGMMLAAASGLIMLSVGLDNALFWTVILFMLSYIPVIGVTVGSVAPALFALLQFPTFWQAAVVFGGIQVAAFVVGNLIYPRMQADTQNIDPVATILALSFWSFIWGIPGAFMAVPLTLMLMMVCAEFANTRWVAVLLSNDGSPPVPSQAAQDKLFRLRKRKEEDGEV